MLTFPFILAGGYVLYQRLYEAKPQRKLVPPPPPSEPPTRPSK
jgi:hypothetical protein